ncbi:MAG: GNAT family N-acetyltransferase, partial [Pseudomonadota bacterium]
PPPKGTVTLRATELGDAEQLAALANLPGYRAGTLRPPFQSVAATRRFLERIGENSVSIVAIIDGELVGSAGLQRFAGRRAHAAGVGIGVHDNFTGRGIGTALLGALIDSADNWLGLTRIELSVFTDNAPAIRLYEKAGFVREGIHRGYALRHGRYVDALAMGRVRIPQNALNG